MNFGQAIQHCLLNTTDFISRASRSEFWWFCLFKFVICVIFATISELLGIVVQLILLLPMLAVGARRLHDIDKSGWWQLLIFLPLVGAIALIVMWALPGNDASNSYGDPV